MEKGRAGLQGRHHRRWRFAFNLTDGEIHYNRFLDTKVEKNLHYYGIKVRKGLHVRVHHYTIETNFSIEFAHENDDDVEIDHNICRGTVSIPKHGGGSVPKSGRTFHIHHNYFTYGYSIEFPRNGAEIDHNLFDFDVVKADGNYLVSGFVTEPAAAPALFHNNLVGNPGRGVMWFNGPYANLTVRNNEIVTRTTPTPRTEGLFAFNPKSDFKTFVFENNLIECMGQARPLFRNEESSAAKVINNKLVNVTETDRYENNMTDAKVGLEEPLAFDCGVNGELSVKGWETELKK